MQDPWKVIKITRQDLKRIESFLVGDSGPDVFHNIQSQVLATLEREHYPAFLVSETCYTMLEDAQENGITLRDVQSPSNGKGSIVDLLQSAKSEGSYRVDTPHTKSMRSSSNLWGDGVSDMNKTCSYLDPTAESILLNDHSSFAKSHLEYIGERLQNKAQALKALKSSLKPNSKVSKSD